MKGKKFLKIKKNDLKNLPIKFKFIDFWKFDDGTKRIDNYNDPYFDGMKVIKYQSNCYMPMGSIKPISKIIEFNLIDKDEKKG